jgi:hypothetical protein
MDVNQLIQFLQRVYVWIPQRNPMRDEIRQVINTLKQQRR